MGLWAFVSEGVGLVLGEEALHRDSGLLERSDAPSQFPLEFESQVLGDLAVLGSERAADRAALVAVADPERNGLRPHGGRGMWELLEEH